MLMKCLESVFCFGPVFRLILIRLLEEYHINLLNLNRLCNLNSIISEIINNFSPALDVEPRKSLGSFLRFSLLINLSLS